MRDVTKKEVGHEYRTVEFADCAGAALPVEQIRLDRDPPPAGPIGFETLMLVAEARRAAEHAARESYGRILAFLAARTRDVAGAEDALSDAFASALSTWPAEGVPNNPDAWLLTTARRRLTDVARHRQVQSIGQTQLQLMGDELEAMAQDKSPIPDRRLVLMFACAHPAIEQSMRTSLILQTTLGLTSEDIAAAFLIPPKTMGQRLVRAKTRIRDTGIARPPPKLSPSLSASQRTTP
jgi:RNA polymerase sigma-70 factor, ECF subfamily